MKKLITILASCFLAVTIFAQTEMMKPEGLKTGDAAPDINAIDQDGKKVQLKELLKKGDVVVIFYRGQWCPFCSKQLSKVNDSLSFVTAKGANVIAVTPETADNIKKTIEKTKASFSIIEDKNMAIMKSYKVNFAVDEKTVEKYKTYGIDFDKANGSNGANLPVPATYIIGKDGKIKYAFFNPDYRQRSSVKEILEHL
ncbi:peroxiredoxin-like family protein [Ferruginibacter sp.]